MISNGITQWIFAWFSVLIETSGTGRSSLDILSSHDLVTVTTPEVLESLKSYTFSESLLFWDPVSAATSFVLLAFENSIGGGTTRISNIRGDWHCCQKRESQDHAWKPCFQVAQFHNTVLLEIYYLSVIWQKPRLTLLKKTQKKDRRSGQFPDTQSRLQIWKKH